MDTANLDEIKAALDTGWVDGVTTNPSLLAKEPKGKFEEHIGKIIDTLQQYTTKDEMIFNKLNRKHLSVEVFSRDPEQILEQAKRFQEDFDYPALSVKVQVGWKELGVIRRLSAEGVSVNCTACMTVAQAAWAAKAGAKYASLFWGRIRDGRKHMLAEEWLTSGALSADDFDPASVVRRTRKIFDREEFNCEIIVGSIRTVWDVRDAMLAGAHIVTVPYKFFQEFPKMTEHYKTDEVVDQFLKDFEAWLR